MSEETPDSTEAVEESANGALKRNKWSGKRITMIALPLILICAAAATYAVSQKNATPDSKAGAAISAPIEYVEMPDMLVNLASTGGRNRYLKLGITLQVTGADAAKELEKHMPRIRSAFQVYLREVRIEDLSGSGGMFFLKEELMRRINTELDPIHIDDVLFKEMLIQ
jgi:flagellar protein FliL